MSATKTARVLILVADDDELLRESLVECLERDGFEVVSLADGDGTLRYLTGVVEGTRACPSVLILDFCMPGFSGLGIARLLYRLERRPPVLILSGFPDSSLERLTKKAGVLRLLRKPIDYVDLRAAVNAALGGVAPASGDS